MSKKDLLKAIDGVLEELKKADPKTHLSGSLMQKGIPAPAPAPAMPGQQKPKMPTAAPMQAPSAPAGGSMKAPPAMKAPSMKAPPIHKALSASEDKGHGEHLAKWMKGYMAKCSMAKSDIKAKPEVQAQPLSPKVKEATASIPLSAINDKTKK